jgi:hypothetical protein
MSVNEFLALFFRFSYEKIVFDNADKAYLLYTGLLATFLVRGAFNSTQFSAQSVSHSRTRSFTHRALRQHPLSQAVRQSVASQPASQPVSQSQSVSQSLPH